MVVEDKRVLMRKLGKKQLTLQLQAPLQRVPGNSPASRWNWPTTATRWSTPSTRRPSAAASRRCCAASATSASASGPAFERKSSLERSSSAWCMPSKALPFREGSSLKP